jgi:UDP-N-acetylglucosamine 2-epimerase (non-hydrolysing)
MVGHSFDDRCVSEAGAELGAVCSPAVSSLSVACVSGARPNFPKLKPVLDALEERSCQTYLVHTGQHYDHTMSDIFLDELGIRKPDWNLAIGSGSHGQQTARIMEAFEPILDELRPDVVLVVGDVNSTVACALVAAKAGCLVAHVEAGLRSRDWAMPEEVNRVVTDRLSDYLFATSRDAVENLKSEGYREDQIHLVGNVMIDSLLANKQRALGRQQVVLDRLGVEGPYALATLHRPSNVDDPDTFNGVLQALSEISAVLPVVFPAHPRTFRRITESGQSLPGSLVISEPLGYLDFLGLEIGARLVLTDSGGVQEETTALGVPCLTLRDSTERPVTIAEGTNRLAGTTPSIIVGAAMSALEKGGGRRRPELWDGRAASRIADILVSGGRSSDRRRPTEL